MLKITNAVKKQIGKKSKEEDLIHSILKSPTTDWERFTALSDNLSEYSIEGIIDALYNRFQSKKSIVRQNAISLWEYLNVNLEFQLVYSLTDEQRLAKILETFPEQSLLIHAIKRLGEQNQQGPFKEFYGKLLKTAGISIEVLEAGAETPMQQSYKQIKPNLYKSEAEIMNDLNEHCDNVLNGSDLFVQCLRANTGYIGNNETARELHNYCLQLKITNDEWLETIGELGDQAVEIMITCAEKLNFAFEELAKLIAHQEFLEAEKRLVEAENNYNRTSNGNGMLDLREQSSSKI